MTPEDLARLVPVVLDERARTVEVPPLARRGRHRGLWGAAALAAAVTAVVALNGVRTPAAPRAVPSPTPSRAVPSPSGTGSVVGSRVASYCTVGDLVTDSEAVVVGTATDGHSDDSIGRVRFRTTTVEVAEVLRGVLSENEVQVRQTLGTTTAGAVALRPGARYVLFLTGPDQGHRFVVGVAAGQFEIRDGRVFSVDAESPGLPTEVPLDEFSATIRSAKPTNTC